MAFVIRGFFVSLKLMIQSKVMQKHKGKIIFSSLLVLTIAILLQTESVISATPTSLGGLTGKPSQNNNQATPGVKIIPNYGGSPLWSTQPNCYKHQGNPGGPQVLMAQTCNAGRKREGRRIVYYSDCGVRNSVGCDRNLSAGIGGCLWYVCQGNNAIWDPKTKKCGCDNGSGQKYNLEKYTNNNSQN